MKSIHPRARWAGMALILALALSGCGKAAALTDVLQAKGITADSPASLKAELRYLKESKGSNYLYAELAGADSVQALLACLAAGAPAQKPEATQYTPELQCDCEIVITDANGAAVSLYYDMGSNLLIFPEVTGNGEKQTIAYRYFTPDAKLNELVTGQKQYAKLMEDNAVESFRNMMELKASIDAEELAEEGSELSFEFYSADTPANTGTACSVYTAREFAAVPEDSCLILTYGKSKAGEQQKLSVIGFEANTHYTKILVTEPDEALESVDTGDEAPDAYAIIVKKTALNPDKWLVFVSESGQVLDVILPEDIDGLRQAAAAAASASPQPTEEADVIE